MNRGLNDIVKIKPKTKKTTISFPFLGAGEGCYYEWCEVYVYFLNKPTQEAIKEITKLAPKPIKPTKADFCGRMLVAGSDQFVNMWIEEEYGTIKKSVKKVEEDGDDLDRDLFDVSAKALAAFEAHLEKWLIEIHAICPIEIAYRPEDWEAGGTKLSAWHKQSLKAIPNLLNKWSSDEYTYLQTKKELELFNYVLSGALEYGKIKEEAVSERMLDLFYPEKKINQLLDKGDVNVITDYFKSHKKNSEVIDVCCEKLQQVINTKNYDQIILLSDFYFDLVFNPSAQVYGVEMLGGLCHAAVCKNDAELKTKIVNKLSHLATITYGVNNSCYFANNLCCYIFKLHGEESWSVILELYQLALNIESDKPCTVNLQLYNNALWAVLSDNNGLPINKELNVSFLAKCLPYGPSNPDIFFNAACLWVEMNDYHKALEYVKLAKQYKSNNYDEMIKQITKTEKLFAEFRKFGPFVTWLAKSAKN